MDLIKPNLLMVNGRCYRSFYSGEGTIHSSGVNSYEIDEEYVPDEVEENLDENNYGCVEIEKDDNGNFIYPMAVAPEFYGMIIGYKGQTLNKLEYATKCRVIIPKRDDSSNKTITLRSSAKRSILSARSKILAIIEKSRSKFEPNYFISIPIEDDSITQRYLQFKDQVLTEVRKEPRKYEGICEEIFQDPGRLHLTICMLLIMDQADEKAQVISKLEKVYHDKILNIINKKKIIAKISGLAYMNDDIDAVDVLYGKIEPNPDLQSISELIVDQFKDTLFISRERAKVILHLTLLNSKFKLDKAEREGWLRDRKKDKREKFSISELLRKFGDFHFGETQIKSIELSIRHTRTIKGGYKSALTLDLTKTS
ncbi:activating signal cointegrator 1 complex subunit 1-like [Panonychus citri]|uniref:activating signal cointegrator 1 complex subunit 1-like n=1 Tax=Panonychus citri TaxID=50023 RepID=UPI002306E327|nr:activating signal cointegrator 1 complex subunit 1-like [Panonychus citri]XP_053200239.1 activating signal cointegrator 1 complex subunit 1-like [Panonychus citri]